MLSIMLLLMLITDRETTPLEERISAAYQMSVHECKQFNEGDEGCVKTQFLANYRYYVVKDVPSGNGPPGTPGPKGGWK
jgi:hypothetical protein